MQSVNNAVHKGFNGDLPMLSTVSTQPLGL